MKDQFKLDAEEQLIEDEIDEYVEADEETVAKVASIARRARKRRNVNIRISEADLERIRRRAADEGVPYQTLISSVLHRFVTDQLVDERHVQKAIELIATGTK